MSAISNAYLIIFLPLISSLLSCFSSRKTVAFSIVFITQILLLILCGQNLINVLAYKKIISNFDFGTISLALEFSHSAFAAVLLFLIIFAKSLIFWFFVKDLQNFLQNKQSQNLFFTLYLLQFFILVAIFSSDNFFNLIIFIEIYLFSIIALVEIFLNQNEKSWKCFLFNTICTFFILFSLVIINLIFDANTISKINEKIFLIRNSNNYFIITLLLIITSSLLAKFASFFLLFKSEKNLNSQFVLSEIYFVSFIVAIFINLKFFYLFFGQFASALIKNFAPFLIIASFLIALQFVWQSKKINNFKQISHNIFANNIATILLIIAFSNSYSFQALFFVMLNFLTVNLAFFLIFALNQDFEDENSAFLTKILDKITLPIKFLLFFLSAFPLTFLFFANWYLIKAAFETNLYFATLPIIALINFSYISVALKLFDNMAFEKHQELNLQSQKFYFISVALLFLAIILFFFNSAFLKDLSFAFANSLVNFY